MGGSSKKVTVGYRYYLGMHMILCHGPIDKLVRILVDKRVAWSGGSTGGAISVQAPDLFGGESREGGVSGAVDFENGLPTQGQNTYLASKLGPDVPSFRGVAGLVLRQCYLGINPYLKAWSFRAQRIHVRQNGLAQWYDEKAEIGTILYGTTIPASTSFDYQILPYIIDTSTPEAVAVLAPPSDGWGQTGLAPFGRAGTGGSLTPVHPINTFWGYNTSLWLRKVVYFDGAQPLTLSGYVENGAAFFLDGKLVYSVNLDNTQSATASGIPYSATLNNVSIGFHVLHILVLDEVDGAVYPPEFLDANDNTYFFCEVGALEVAFSDGDMNPAHIIRECLTDPDWGMGYQESDIDDMSFRTAADTLFTEGLGMSLLWDRQTAIEDFVKEVVRHIQASLYVDRTTGKFKLKLIRADYDEGSLLVLNESCVEKVENFARPSFGDMVNSVTVNYWDSATATSASVTAQDTALIQMQGAVVGTTIRYPGCTKQPLAAKLATRDLRTLSTPLLSCTVYANRKAASLNVGDPFVLDWPNYLAEPTVMRVIGLALGDGRSNKVKITCTEDAFSFPETAVVRPEVPDWEDPSGVPSPAVYRVVAEAPYYELVQRLGQTTTDEQLAANPDIGYLLGSAATPGSAINARMAVDAGAGYDGNDTPMDFCPAAFLAADLAPGATSVAITNGQSLSSVVAGTHAQIGAELVKVVTVTDSLLTIGRGVLDTVPAAHVAGTPVLFWDAYADSDGVEYVSGEVVGVKMMPVSGAGQLPLADAAEDTLTFASRAYRPYPPGNLQINGVPYPQSITDVGVTWAWSHRDRLQQTAGDIVDTTAGNIGPEAGTTYSLKIYGESDNLLRTVTGLAGTTYAYSYSDEVAESGLGAGGTPSLNPGSAPGLLRWYRAQSLALSDGAAISSWTDLSPNSNHATQDTASAKPTFKANILSGKAVARFDGGDWLSLGELFDTTSSVGAMLIVAKNSSASPGVLLSTRPASMNQGWTFRLNTATTGVYFHTGYSPTAANSFTDAFHIHMVLRNGLTVTLGVDGVLGGATTIASYSPSSLGLTTIGAENSGSGSLLIGDIAEIVILDNTDTTTISRLVQYLKEEYFGATPATSRSNGKLRIELKSVRDGLDSYQTHDYTVRRSGYGFNYGEFYGGV